MRNRIQFTTATLALLFSLVFIPSSEGSQQSPTPADQKGHSKSGSSVVYVCACLKNKSCSCMTEAKTEGPCACGTDGGPPMKAVPSDSNWAKENREALAK
jgi:hypothetical protein